MFLFYFYGKRLIRSVLPSIFPFSHLYLNLNFYVAITQGRRSSQFHHHLPRRCTRERARRGSPAALQPDRQSQSRVDGPKPGRDDGACGQTATSQHPIAEDERSTTSFSRRFGPTRPSGLSAFRSSTLRSLSPLYVLLSSFLISLLR